MEWILVAFIWVLLGFWCKSLAKKRGLNEWLAFAIGFLFGLVAVIVYACLGETQEHKIQREVEYEKLRKTARKKAGLEKK